MKIANFRQVYIKILWPRGDNMDCLFFKNNQKRISVCTCDTPPRIISVYGYIELVFNGVVVADSVEAKIVAEPHRPPVLYFPREDVKLEYLTPSYLTAMCKWKGRAQFVMVEIAKRKKENIGWYYPDPEPLYTGFKNHIAFYTHLMDGCYFDWKKVNYNKGKINASWFCRENTVEEGVLEKVGL
jgi:uncharacterized protein (DUF427 family)